MANHNDIKDVLKQADGQVKILEQKLHASSRGRTRHFDLCQNDNELNVWLAEWSVTPNHVSDRIEAATDERERLDARRSKGVHRLAASTQRFASQMREFSTSYSGLIDVIGGVTGPYGQAASAGFKALSCLFLAATNKTGNETLVTDRLEEINRFFPRVGKMQAIYKDDVRIGMLVALIHLDMVRFVDKAVEYFSSRWRRALDILIPPGFKSDPTYDSMKTRLVELRSWANLNLHQNAAETREELISTRGQLREMRFQQIEASKDLTRTQVHLQYANEKLADIRKMIRRQEEEIEMQLLTTLRKQLQVDDSSTNFDVEACSRLSSKIIQELTLNRPRESKATFMSRDKLEQDGSFAKWRLGTHRLLLVGGVTTRDLMGLSWLTPVVLELAIECSRDSDVILGFFSGQPGELQYPMSFPNMLLGIVLGIARQVPSILREDAIRQVGRTLSTDCSNHWTLGDWRSLAEVVAKFLVVASAERRIRLVINRLELIDEAEQRCSEIMQCLDCLVSKVPRLTILVAWSLTFNKEILENKLDTTSNLVHNLGLDLPYY